MKVAIATVQVPFISGGAEIHADSLRKELRRRGYDAEIVTLPFKWYPPERLLDCMLMARLVDLTEVNGQKIERVVALKYPAYYLEHPNKVCWILHQHRQAYELYGTAFGDLEGDRGRRVVDEIRRWDNALLPASRAIFANSRTVAQRLKRYNNIDAKPLYHPPGNHEMFRCDGYGDFVLYPGRFDSIKRQHLLVDSLALTKEPVKAVFIGNMSGSYGDGVRSLARHHGLEDRISFMGVVDEETKFDLYARCLAVYNGVYEEDYGYLTLEGFFASKPVVTHVDSGGPLEFVQDGITGFVTRPEPPQIAAALDRLFAEPAHAERLGVAGRLLIDQLGIHWDNVVTRLMQ